MISQAHLSQLHNDASGNFERFESHDFEETKAYATSLYCPHNFILHNNASNVDAHFAWARLNKIGMADVGYGANVTIDPNRLEDFYLIQTVISGSVEVISGNQRCLSTPGIATVISPNQPTVMHWDSDARFLSVKIERQQIESQLSEFLAHKVENPVIFDLKLDLNSDVMKPWDSVVDSLFYQLQFGNSQNDDISVSEIFERWMISNFLHTQPHNYSEQLKTGVNGKTPASIRLAIQFIHEHLNEPLKNNDVALAAGISERTLNNLMHQFVGKTSKQYILHKRLAVTRSKLQNPATACSVTKVLSDIGIQNHGRFSAIYKEKFGELPSETLTNARA